MPNIGMVPMIDAETGETQWLTLVRKRFDSTTRNINDQLVYFKETFSKCWSRKYQSRRKLCDQIEAILNRGN
jgi:hypothetical protein